MMSRLWDCEATVASMGVEVPQWIEQDISVCTVAAIVQGCCESGAYMPAVTYHTAVETMGKHGDYVLDFISDNYGSLVDLPPDTSWSGIAVHYLSSAVDLWAILVEGDLEEKVEEIEDARARVTEAEEELEEAKEAHADAALEFLEAVNQGAPSDDLKAEAEYRCSLVEATGADLACAQAELAELLGVDDE
jgi:hypothetical protein